ncbi:hypothetical protein FQA39_LY05606 [Lamprigera yunnana]|nr:hypothetical protein FQA39_LY05606 [Lamprigera yunnana]
MKWLIDILVLLVCIIVFSCIYFQKRYRYWKDKNVPYETPRFLFGSLLDMLLGKETLAQYFQKLYEKFDSPYVGFYILNKPILVLKGPEELEYVLIKDFKYFSDKIMCTDEDADPIWENVLMTVPHKKWRFFRSHLSQTFSTGKLKNMLSIIKQNANNLDVYLKSFAAVKDVHGIFGRYATDTVCQCLFGIDAEVSSATMELLSFHAKNCFSNAERNLFKLYTYNFLHGPIKLFKYAFVNDSSSKFFLSLFRNVFEQRETRRSKRSDLIDFLIDLKEKAQDDGVQLGEIAFVSQAIGFLIAGQGTIASIISYTLHEICVNTDIQDRLRKEVDEVLEEFGDISYEGIQNMKYMDMVVSETLRKYPVLNFIHRKCIQDYRLPSTGLKIDKGTDIIIPLHGLHFDPNYFPDPHKYDPERFSDANLQFINPFIYQPFGVGPRNCIGKRFALLNVKFLISFLVKKFHIKLGQNGRDHLVFKTTHLTHAAEEIEINFESL